MGDRAHHSQYSRAIFACLHLPAQMSIDRAQVFRKLWILKYLITSFAVRFLLVHHFVLRQFGNFSLHHFIL